MSGDSGEIIPVVLSIAVIVSSFLAALILPSIAYYYHLKKNKSNDSNTRE